MSQIILSSNSETTPEIQQNNYNVNKGTHGQGKNT